jgi:uncharacterized membrane protein YedE/YeeE
MIELIKGPWPWYVAGPLIGLMVPVLLLLGNHSFGISGNLRHICAACIPAGLPFFKYNWKAEAWNLFFAAGIIVGAFVAVTLLHDGADVVVSPALKQSLLHYGVTDYSSLVPRQLFNWEALLTFRGFIMIVFGGFLVGFGTRYAGGCTSGHSILGLSTLQWPSLVATCSFMVGGFIMANFILPIILSL